MTFCDFFFDIFSQLRKENPYKESIINALTIKMMILHPI